MSMITEKITMLRDVAQAYNNSGIGTILNDAANTIEELSAKLVAANMERSTAYYNSNALDSLHEKILKSKFAEEVTESEIDALIKAKQCLNDGWIPCSERLPEEKENPVTRDFYVYPVMCDFAGISDIRYYAFGRGHWHHGPSIMDRYVTHWADIKPLPAPYKQVAWERDIAIEQLHELGYEFGQKIEEEYCEWRLCDEQSNVYDTSCRNPHILIDGSPSDNKYEFCPYCGKKIKVVE